MTGVDEVSPVEDLMREHGVLNRLLLIYDDISRKMDLHQAIPLNSLRSSAKIIKNFIENYHEKLEEEYVFTRFEKAEKMTDLVKTLREQHQKGRVLTDYILTHCDNHEQQKNIPSSLQQFITMYRPHAAREDTVLFPTLKTLISEKEYDSLGDIFEKKEQELFGKNGFNTIVEEVARIEQELGIYNLAQFTPQKDSSVQ